MRAFVTQSKQVIRAYQGGIGKTAVIYPAAFLVALALGQLVLGMVLYAKTALGVSETRIGILVGASSLTYVAGCLLLRPRFSRVLPRYLITASTTIMAGLTLGMVLYGSYPILLSLLMLFGLVMSLFWPPMMGWVSTASEGPSLGRVIGRFNLAWCSGTVVSPFLCGWLSERDPLYPLMLTAGLLMLVAAFVAGASLALPRIRGDRLTGFAHDALPQDRDRSCPLRYPAWIGLFASFYGNGVLSAVLPLVALQEWGAAETGIGLVFTARGLTNALGFILLGRIHAWHFRLSPMLAAQWLGVLVFALLAWSGSVSMAAPLLGLYGLASALAYSASVFHGAAGSLNRARRMAIHESVLAAGIVSGSFTGGWLYERLPAVAVFSLVALLLAGLTGLQTLAGCAVGTAGTGSRPS